MEEKTQNFWKGTRGNRPFYKVPIFYLICLVIVGGIFALGFFSGKRGTGKKETGTTVRRIEDQIGLAEKDKKNSPTASAVASVSTTVQPKSSISPTSNEFTGWSGFENRAVNIRLYYPANWIAEKVDGKNIIAVHSGDDKYYLYIGVRKKGDKSEIIAKNSLPGGDPVKDSKVIFADTSVDRYKIASGGKTKAYLYPKDTAQSQDGAWELSASFTRGDLNEDQSADLEVLDERVIGEKILKSVEIIKD